MKVLLFHPTGNNFSKALARRLTDRGFLYKLCTTIATFEGDWIDHMGAVPPFTELRRRKFDSELKLYTETYPLFEIGRQLASKFKIKSLISNETGLFSVDSVYRHFDAQVAKTVKIAAEQGATHVYGYEDGALETFREAKKHGLRCVYDLPIAYWETSRRLLQQEATRLSQWNITLGGGIQDSAHKLKRKTEELALADIVVVPSQFVEHSLPAWAANKQVVVSPFGTPITSAAERSPQSYSPANRPLRVLFAGSMGQRKGLGDLFTAVNLLGRPDLELVVLGSPIGPMNFYRHQLANFTFEQGRPNEQVLALMRTCDVFCLPSIVEGRALVMQEAMSQGLPLLITPNTGGVDLVLEGRTGFVIPIRTPEAIARKLSWFLDNRSQISVMGQLAQKHAQTYTWTRYSDSIIEKI